MLLEADGTTAAKGEPGPRDFTPRLCTRPTALLSPSLTFSLGTSCTRTSSVMVPTTTAVLPSRPGSFIFRIFGGGHAH